MKRAKIILSGAEVHHLLGLHPEVRITAFTARHDPVSLDIHLEGDRFSTVHPDEESNVVGLWECRPIPESELLRMAGVGTRRPSAGYVDMTVQDTETSPT